MKPLNYRNVCAYCDYPIDAPHEGGTTGEEQCDVCGANESRQIAWSLTEEQATSMLSLKDGESIEVLPPGFYKTRIGGKDGKLNRLGAAVVKHLKGKTASGQFTKWKRD
jgi:hypothetical protein